MNKMNQTQTRSPRKRLLSLILAVILMIGLLPISAFATSASAQAGEDKAATQDSEFLRIFHLDCGRKYFTVSEIEGIIDQLAENHYTHIQLAFGNNGFRFLLNDMSVKANNKTYSSDDVKNAVTNGNTTYSNGKNTASTMLSETDMDTIIAYAKGKDISIIPMLNTPGHMDALVSAMMELNVGTQRSDSEMSLTSDAQVEFIKALQQKYITYFASKGSKYYNLAADEYSFSGLSNTEYTVFAKYVNEVAKMVKDAKMTPLAYNDGFLYSGKTTSVPFDKDIVICYWAQDTNYASVTELHNAGFKILNNNDAWYYVLGDYLNFWEHPQWRYADAKEGIQKVPVTQAKNVADKEIPVVGSVLCCWCDGPHLSWADSKDKVYDLIATMAENNPDYFKDTAPVLAPVDGGTVSPVKQADGSYNVAVAANDTVQLKLSNASDVSWSSSDKAVATVDVSGLVTFTGKTGTVKITAQLQPVTRADEGTSYTVTFNVTEKGAPIPVTVAVGRTVKETLQGNQTAISGNYSEFVTVTADHKTTTAEKKLLEITSASDLVSGAQYLIANQRMGAEGNTNQLLTTEPSEWKGHSVLALSGAPATDSTAIWTITKTNSGYTLKNGSYYLNIGNNTASVGSKSNLTFACQDNNGTAGYPDKYWNISYSQRSATYYLNALGGQAGAGGWQYTSDNGAAIDIGSRWTIYRIVDEGATDTTTVSFTGKKVGGPVTVTVGDTTYSVTVVEKQNVEIPISIIDYRADGLLFDFYYQNQSYAYGLVHVKDSNNYVSASTAYGTKIDGASYGTKISGTTLERTRTGGTSGWTDNSLDNSWSRAGLVEKKLGTNGMPEYTSHTIEYVAGLLAAGNVNDVSGNSFNCNTVLQDTFLKSTSLRKVLNTSTTGFSDAFKATHSYANITNAYDLAWYLLNNLYVADTNMITVTGTDRAKHQVPIYGMAVDAYKSIVLTDNGSGTYSFEAGYTDNPKYVDYDGINGTISQGTSGTAAVGFYPLEGLGYEKSGLLTNTSYVDKAERRVETGRNGSFTLRGESQFVYNEDAELYFTFTGDDDVYMYINGVLALDLGGAHGRNWKTVKLNELNANEYGLEEGQVATFTFFYMERCSDASTFGIETNMELVQRDINVEKNAYSDSQYTENSKVKSGEAVSNESTVYYDLVVSNQGNTPMTNISISDTDSFGGSALLGAGQTAAVTAGRRTEVGLVSLGEQGYTYFIVDKDGNKGASKTCSTLDELSGAVAALKLEGGAQLHIRFLTAKVDVAQSKIISYTNTLNVTAVSGGKTLSDSAIHTIYSYNAGGTDKTYVVDFGLPLRINGIFDSGAGKYIDANTGAIELKEQPTYGNVTDFESKGMDTSMVYQLKANTTINGRDTIKLSVPYNFGSTAATLDKNVYIIPASNVYYEDSLATFTDGSGVAQNAVWSTVGNDDKVPTEQTDVYQALEELGKHSNVYGHDGAYNSSSMLSMGTAHKVTVTANMANTDAWTAQPTSAWPTAQFTFKGTGFDIISLTNNKSGTIFVDVTNTATGKQYNYVVNNYYGYTCQNGEWVVDKNASDTLYQIPVMKVDGLGYGEYNVVIKVAYNKFFDTAEAKEYSFWLDAVRIYDPMGEYADYTQDNEGYPQYIKLRDTLVDGTAKPDGTDKTVFIDGGSTADIKTTYANYGPNNEVYLMKGQAITFKIPANDKIASIQIGAKAPKGTANLNVNETEIVSGGLSTATEMYYQIANAGGQFTITNTGDGILSLTNLKITFKNKPTEKITLAALNTQEQENAVSLVRALFTAPVATFSPETFEADWGRAVRAGKRATLTVKTSADVESITVDGQSITSYTTRTQRTGWGWWSPKVTYHVFTYTITAPAQTTDYAVCAVNAEGTASEAVTATLTVKPTTWWNWWF